VSDLGWIARESFVWLECNECKGQRNSTSTMLSMTRRVWVVSKWWLKYLTSATAALMERPAGATVVSPVLMDEALGKASRCTNCRTRAFADMREFGAMFAAEVSFFPSWSFVSSLRNLIGILAFEDCTGYHTVGNTVMMQAYCRSVVAGALPKFGQWREVRNRRFSSTMYRNPLNMYYSALIDYNISPV
jgi:hypothetical protein